MPAAILLCLGVDVLLQSNPLFLVQGPKGETKCHEAAAAPLLGWGGSPGRPSPWGPNPQHCYSPEGM